MRSEITPVQRILFVCMGNICRSPAAEGVMQAMAAEAGLENQLFCDSAGTIDFHRGQAADPRMLEAAARRGYTLGSRARQMTAEDLVQFDLILTMDEDNREYVLAMDGESQWGHKIKPFCDFVDAYDAAEVPDPYYGGVEGFDRVLDMLEDGCRQLLDHCAVPGE